MAHRTKRLIAAVALTSVSLALAACSDSVTAPAQKASLAPAGAHMIVASTSSFSFVLNPTIDNVFQSAEGHRLVLPANSICNPATSGYGSAYWDQSCTTASAPILFTVTTTTNSEGYSRLVVSPDVRFSPSKQVMVFLKDAGAANKSGAVIAYCSLLGCTNEGKNDASLSTLRDPATGYVFRRLKHFSGYNITYGFNCDADPSDPSCTGGDLGGFTNVAPLPKNRFSGYITTVGFSGSDDTSIENGSSSDSSR